VIVHAPTNLWQGSTQIESCQRTCEAHRSRGHRIAERVFSGGHDPKYWEEDLALALPWMWQEE
jgi:S-formylglutathione hydrolase FrmB